MTGSIWLVLILHSLHDILTFSAAYNTPSMPDAVYIEWFIIEGLLAVYGFYLIRKAKRPEIKALWDKKWNREGSES